MKKENIFLVLGIVTIIGFFVLAFYYMQQPPEPQQTAATPTPSIQMPQDGNFNPNYGDLSEDEIQIADMAIGKLLNSVDGITPPMIIVHDVIAQDFSDTSLGCPKPDQMYAQVITPGYQVILEVQGTQYDYRLTDQDNVILCEQ